MRKGNIIFWSLLILFLVLSLWLVNHRRKSVVCSHIDVIFLDTSDNKLMDEQEVIDVLENAQGKILGTEIGDLNLAVLEDALYQQPPVKHAEVYKTIDGELKVEITQRTPILRIYTDSLSYYIDSYGAVMPLPKKYRPRVLPASGFIRHKSKQIVDLYQLAKYINEHNFWKAQIQQIYVNKKGDIELIPRVGAQTIVLGSIKNMEKKFRKLMALYQYGFKVKDWNKYKQINLKFKNQVVCVKSL